MAALRPCPSSIVSPAAASSFNLLRPSSSSWPPRSIVLLPKPKMHRGNVSLAIRAHKDPEDGMSADYEKKWEEIKKIAKGPADMPFRQEIEKIDEYTKKIHNTSILDCAVLARDTTSEFSLHTIKQTLQMFVCIIVNTAEDSYNKKVTKETIVSFLGALEGVAAISHILVQDTMENHAINSKDRSLNYSPENDRAAHRARMEYVGKMKTLKHEFMTARMTDAYQILESTLADAIMCTQVFVITMNAYRKWTLGHVRGRTRAQDHGEPNQ